MGTAGALRTLGFSQPCRLRTASLGARLVGSVLLGLPEHPAAIRTALASHLALKGCREQADGSAGATGGTWGGRPGLRRASPSFTLPITPSGCATLENDARAGTKMYRNGFAEDNTGLGKEKQIDREIIGIFRLQRGIMNTRKQPDDPRDALRDSEQLFEPCPLSHTRWISLPQSHADVLSHISPPKPVP